MSNLLIFPVVACSTFIVRFVADRGFRSFPFRVGVEVPDGVDVGVSPLFVVVVAAFVAVVVVVVVVVVVMPLARLLMIVAVVAVILFNNFAA